MNYNINGIKVLTDPVELAQELDKCQTIAYDCETNGLSAFKNSIELMQFYGDEAGVAGLIKTPGGLIPEPMKHVFKKGKRFIAHNGANFDWHFLDTHGIDWKQPDWFDTLIGETVVVATSRRDVRVNLKDTIKRRLGIEIDKTVEHSWANETLTDRQVEYAITDVINLPALMRSQMERAEQTKQVEAINMEMQVAPCYAQMSINGLLLPADQVRMYADAEQAKAQKLQVRIFERFGPINLNSPLQVKKALLSIGVETDSTSADALADIIVDGGIGHEEAAMILEVRHALQRTKMYTDGWIAKNIHQGRVHARFWQCGTDTGRSSSSDPNLQQVPKDGRKMFGNTPGFKVVSCDYSQIEVRIAAWLARDKAMQAALDGEDMHSEVAAKIFKVDVKDVTKEQRKMAKACSFTLLFGGGPQRLFDYGRRQGSSLTMADAEKIAHDFMIGFTGIMHMKNNAIRMSNRPGPLIIRMPNGFRRVLVGQDKTMMRILNTSVQGTAAVGLKYGLLEAEKSGLTKYLGAAVHDELVACVPDNEAAEYGEELKQAMIRGMARFMDVPVKAEMKMGDTWQM